MRRIVPPLEPPLAGIDPTQNVNALVAALEEKTRELMAAETRYQNDKRQAETRRVDQLAAQKQLFDFKIGELVQRNNEKAQELLATALKENRTQVDARIADLQEKSWIAQGQTTKGSDVWIKLTTVAALLIALGSLIVALAKIP